MTRSQTWISIQAAVEAWYEITGENIVDLAGKAQLPGRTIESMCENQKPLNKRLARILVDGDEEGMEYLMLLSIRDTTDSVVVREAITKTVKTMQMLA